MATRIVLVGLALLSVGVVAGLTQLDRGDVDATMTVTVVHPRALRRRARLAARGRPAGTPVRARAPARLRARRRRPPRHPLRVVKLALAGVSHHQAPLALRERVAIDLRGGGSRASSRARPGRVRGRRPLDVQPHRALPRRPADEQLTERADRALLELAGADAGSLAPVAYRLADESAALHLFRVAAGLDSMIPGEGEILGQVRDAFEAGAPGPLLDRTFRMALHAGRRARVETAIGESPSSVPAAAAALAEQVFEGLAGRRVVLVGAGRTSELTARNLLLAGCLGERRRQPVGRPRRAARRDPRCRCLPLDQLAEAVRDADVVVSSTSAPGLVLTRDALDPELRGEPWAAAAASSISPCRATSTRRWRSSTAASCTTSTISRPSSRRRSRAAAPRRSRPSGSSRRRRSASPSWRASLAVVPTITSLRAQAEAIRAAELARAQPRLARLSECERAAVDALTTQIVSKLLHLPTVRLKEAAGHDGRAALC